uniref:Rho-GAP domain-containing protein n=1 Tax=Equus caballus TaxID=9796 RepID=F7ALC2_HORSE
EHVLGVSGKYFRQHVYEGHFCILVHVHWALCLLYKEALCSLSLDFQLPKQNDVLSLKVHFGVFRLLAKLPRANAALLRYLFGVLHNIQQHSSVNQLTAYNLATCIAPSILCLPNACSAELASDITRKISLVQLLIENCLQIFGEDVASLLGESSTRCAGSEKAADPSTDFGMSTKQPLESKPVRVIVTYKKAQLQNDSEAPRGVGPPSYLSAVLSVTED